MQRMIVRTGVALLACGWLSLAAAQSPAVNPREADLAKEQQRQQQVQPLNNEPVWSEVRSGLPQTTSLPGRETNVLIQPEGQTWRAMRVAVVFWGGVLFALAVGGLAVFYLWRGPLTAAEPPGDLVIERFTPADRYVHWLLAITWVTLAITGLILSIGKSVLLPLIGYTLFSWLATLAKNVHNFIGPVLIVAVPLMFVRYLRYNGVNNDDIRWFANIVGYFKGHEYPSGKFNAGEKLVFWILLVVMTTVLVVSGLVLVFPNFDQTRSTMQVANIVHATTAYLGIGLACVHIYLGTIGMTNAYRAMRTGYVTAAWAKHHHQRWYEDVVAGRAREKLLRPGSAPAEGRQAPPARTKPV